MGTVRNLIMRIAGSLLIVAVATYLTNMVDAEVIGTIDVGSVGTIYVWKQFGNIVMEGNGFRMTGDSRGYLLTKDPGASLTPDSFWQTNLFDQHFTYDLNLSGVGCHCNAAGYFIKMPAQVPGGGGDYYCDANYVGGIGCPEYDTLALFIIVVGMVIGFQTVIWVDVAQALGTLEDIVLAEDAPLTVTRSSGSHITRTMTLQTLTWSRMDRESTSTFVIRAGTGV